jgi:hypothetical protein
MPRSVSPVVAEHTKRRRRDRGGYSVTAGLASVANRSLSLSCRAGKRMAKSARRVQAQVTLVADTFTTVHPEEDQRCWDLSYHRQAGMVTAVGHWKGTVAPSDPGPHRKVRAPKGGPQSVDSR